MDNLQYWLLDQNKKPLYVNEAGLVDRVLSGNLKPDGKPAHLKNSPKGWSENVVKYGRDVDLLGMSTDFTIPLDFSGDGAKILKEIKWSQGSEGIVYLVINKLNKTVFPARYDLFHFCEINLQSVKQRKGYVNAQAVEGGLSKLFKANKGTTFEIPIDTDQRKKLLYLDGNTLVQNAKFLAFDGLLVDNNFWAHTVNLELLSTESISEIGAVSSDRGKYENSSQLFSQNNWFLTTGAKPVTITFKYRIGFTVARAPGWPSASEDGAVLLIRTFDSRSTSPTPTEFYELSIYGGAGDLSGHHVVQGNVTVTIPAYRKCFLVQQYALITGGVPNYAVGSNAEKATSWFYDSTVNDTFEIDYTYSATPQYCECLTPKTLADRILEKIAPGLGYTVSSSFLSSLEDSLFITSGMSIRKYGAKSVLKTSFDDFFKSLRRYGLGVGVEGNKLVIEKYDYFFKNTSAITLSQVNEWSIEDAEDLLYNTFKFGYPLADLGKVNGRDDFHVTMQFKAPITRTVKELDWVSIYHASMHEITLTLINLNGKDTTDSPVDNTGFMMAVAKGVDIDYYEGDITAETSQQIKLPRTILPSPIIGDKFTITGTGVIDGTYTLSGFIIVPGSTTLSFSDSSFTTGDYTGTITVHSSVNYRLDRPVFDSVTGLLYPEDAFNIPLSVKRGIIENSGYLHSILDFMDDKLFEFTTGERNSSLVTIQAGVTIEESKSEPIGSFKPQLFKPYYIKIKTTGLSQYQENVKINPYEKINFPIDGSMFSGYLFDGDFNPNTQGETELKLLLAPDTDYAKLKKL